MLAMIGAFVALIIISLLLDEAGFFAWTALHVARWARGDGRRLFAFMVLLGAFPLAFAILLPAFYVPLCLMLFGLVIRGVAFEFRSQGGRFQIVWSATFAAGSFIAAFCQGAVLGAFVGRSITVSDGVFAGGPFDWLGLFSIATGLGVVAAYGKILPRAAQAGVVVNHRHAGTQAGGLHGGGGSQQGVFHLLGQRGALVALSAPAGDLHAGVFQVGGLAFLVVYRQAAYLLVDDAGQACAFGGKVWIALASHQAAQQGDEG